MKNWSRYLVLGVLISALCSFANQGVSDLVRQEIQVIGPDSWISINVILHDQVSVSDLLPAVDGMNPWSRRQYVVEHLKSFTENSQRRIQNYLAEKQARSSIRPSKPV